jgi:uncharacterized damage-inducible protein DinB
LFQRYAWVIARRITAQLERKRMSNLKDLRNEYSDLIIRAHTVFQNVDERMAAQRPGTGRWSMAECVAHLNVTGPPYLENITLTLKHGEKNSSAPRHSTRPGFFAAYLTRFLEPPYRLKMKTMTRYEPQHGAGLDETLHTFDTQQREFIGLIDAMQLQGVPRTRIPSPVQPILRLRADDWLRFLAAHGRRHLWQAEQVRREI